MPKEPNRPNVSVAEAIIRDCGFGALGVYAYVLNATETEIVERLKDDTFRHHARCLIDHGHVDPLGNYDI